MKFGGVWTRNPSEPDKYRAHPKRLVIKMEEESTKINILSPAELLNIEWVQKIENFALRHS